MGKKKVLPTPTDSEVAILRVLWDMGEATVRQVNDEIGRHKRTGYTTTLKLMQIMADKGLVARKMEGNKHIYTAVVTASAAEKTLVENLLEKVFSGSTEKLVLRALSSKRPKAEEIEKIRAMLDEWESKK